MDEEMREEGLHGSGYALLRRLWRIRLRRFWVCWPLALAYLEDDATVEKIFSSTGRTEI